MCFMKSVGELIEILDTLAASKLLPMFTQSFKFYKFHCHKLNSTDVLKNVIHLVD